MLRNNHISGAGSKAWREHNERVRKQEAIGRELENLFPHKFKHPRIGRNFIMDRENGLRVPFPTIKPAVEVYPKRHQSEPRIAAQVLLGLMMALLLVSFCYAF